MFDLCLGFVVCWLLFIVVFGVVCCDFGWFALLF